MDLKNYEQIKFELAGIIRAGQFIATRNIESPHQRWQAEQPWHSLLERLADDCFAVVMAGRFNQGKSSLMNALLGIERLPTGLVPLTSVITCVRYGTSERVLLDYGPSRIRGDATLDELTQYVTERGNPANVKGIRSAEIQLPSEILRRGFFLVDTPGLGSAVLENSLTTEQFLPEIDVLVLVTSYASPLTEDELRFLERASHSVRAAFVVVNKQDTVPPESRTEVLDYVERAVRPLLGNLTFRPFSVSATDALTAKRAGDICGLQASGMLDFETTLLSTLTRDKASLFLSTICDRILAEFRQLPSLDADGPASQVHAVRQRIDEPNNGHGGSIAADVTVAASDVALHAPRRIGPCEVCHHVADKQLSFLARYQYELTTHQETQEAHAEAGGFCGIHTWQYEQIASTRGVCTAYPALTSRVADQLRSLARAKETDFDNVSLLAPQCGLCALHRATEAETLAAILARVAPSERIEDRPLPVLCLPHLQSLFRLTSDRALRGQLLLREAIVLDRLTEDMQRYAIKHDANRRSLLTREEEEAAGRALRLLVGDKYLSGVYPVRDTL